MSSIKELWVEKYRPKRISDYIFQQPSHELQIKQMLSERSITHLLLSGVQGSGKTSLAFILVNELEVNQEDVLIINSSDENSVDVIRDKIKGFASSFAWGDFKVVILEEADYITPNGQAVLRRVMEEYVNNVRFILTCNYEHRIIPAIKSRCQHYKFKTPDKNDVTEAVAKILIQEKVNFNIDVLDKYVSVGYPDIRKIINTLQQHTVDATLADVTIQEKESDYKFEILDLLEKDNWPAIRNLVCSNIEGEEWESMYRFFYENLDKSPKFNITDNWEAAIVIVSDHLYKDALVADREINFAACTIRLGQI